VLKRLLIALCLTATPAAAEPPVWIVRDADSAIVLFGSVHLLPPGLDWRPDALDAALKEADDIWFELPVDAEATREAAQLAFTKGFLPEGESLNALLSPEGAKRLRETAVRLHLDMKGIDRLRPWLADVTISVAQAAGGGANGSDGVERTLMKAAPASAVRRAFETPEEQITIFADIPLPEQIASLEQSLSDVETDPKSFDGMVGAWMAGDLAALEKGALDPMRKATPVLYERFVVERNARWAKAIEERLAGSGESVMVVGAAHLIGKEGLPAMLRARGHTVEGP
jgi:uncharacterized protein YbaP (TraB family)